MKESLVTDECISDCLGLKGSKKLDKYVRNYLRDEGELEIMDICSKSQYELDGLVTIACKFMPSLLPTCAVMYKEGCSFISGNMYGKFLAASPLAVIRYVCLKFLTSVDAGI